jgi:hypothetical protein
MIHLEPVNMRTLLSLIMLSIALLASANKAVSAEEKTHKEQQLEPKAISKVQQSVTIESKITGSQEQPKVLYIMPWQGNTNQITITDKEMQLTLPSFKPIHPKAFKQEVRNFALNQTKVEQE